MLGSFSPSDRGWGRERVGATWVARVPPVVVFMTIARPRVFLHARTKTAHFGAQFSKRDDFHSFSKLCGRNIWPRAANAPISYSIAKRNLIGQDSARSSNSEKSR